MYCSNCGKPLPESANFCPHCGAAANAAVPSRNIGGGAAPVPPIAKAGAGFLSWRVVYIAAACLGLLCVLCFVKVARADLPANANGQSQSAAPTPIPQQNSAYREVFQSHGLRHSPAPAEGLETDGFVFVNGDGSLSCFDFAARDDRVLLYTNTLYYPLAGYDEVQRVAVEAQVRASCADYERIPCCTVACERLEEYIQVSICFSELDRDENCAALYAHGLADSDGPISLSATREQLLADGAVGFYR